MTRRRWAAFLLSVAVVSAACAGGAPASQGPSTVTIPSATGGPRRFLFDGDRPCAIDFSSQSDPLLPVALETASIPTDSGMVWVQTRAWGLDDWDETIGGVGVIRGRFDGRFTLSWEATRAVIATRPTTVQILAPESLEPVIEAMAEQAVASSDHAAVVSLVEAAVGATAIYSGPASAYDVLLIPELSDTRRWLFIAGEPLSAERNRATWGPSDDDAAPGLTSTDLSASEGPAVMDGQTVYWPSDPAPTEATAAEFRDLLESLTDAEPTLVVTESAVFVSGCLADREFGAAAVELPAADVISGYELIETPAGWRLTTELDPPPGFFYRDGSTLSLFFGPSVRLGVELDWDPDVGTFVTPDQVTFGTLLTTEEAQLFDRLLG